MSLRSRRVVPWVLLVTMSLATACSSEPEGATTAPSGLASPVLGWSTVERQPKVELPQGDPISSKELNAGAPWVLINFWASTCGPCREEIPVLNELRNDSMEVVGVSRDQFTKYARAFEEELGADFPSWMDSDGEYSESFITYFPRNALPVSVLVHDGRLVAVHLGPIDAASEVVEFRSTMVS